MILEKIVWSAGEGLASAVALFISIAAVQSGLSKMGKHLKIPLVLTFLSLWGFVTILGFLFGEAAIKNFSLIAVVALLIGISLWLISIIFVGLKKLK